MKTTYDLITDPNWQPTPSKVGTLLSDLHDESDYASAYEVTKIFTVGSGWSVTLMEGYGGREGAGEEHWLVYKLENATQAYQETYWKVPGWYQSYHGAELEWSNTFQVKPTEKVIIVWEKN